MFASSFARVLKWCPVSGWPPHFFWAHTALPIANKHSATDEALDVWCIVGRYVQYAYKRLAYCSVLHLEKQHVRDLLQDPNASRIQACIWVSDGCHGCGTSSQVIQARICLSNIKRWWVPVFQNHSHHQSRKALQSFIPVFLFRYKFSLALQYKIVELQNNFFRENIWKYPHYSNTRQESNHVYRWIDVPIRHRLYRLLDQWNLEANQPTWNSRG